MRADECTCTYYAVDMSDPERYHPENVDREGDPECPVHRDADNVPSAAEISPGAFIETGPEVWPFGLATAAALVARVAWPNEAEEAQSRWRGRLITEPNIRAATENLARRRFESALATLRANNARLGPPLHEQSDRDAPRTLGGCMWCDADACDHGARLATQADRDADNVPSDRAIIVELRDRVASYENSITWDTTCTSCAKVLNSAYRETARAEEAEAEIERMTRGSESMREHLDLVTTALHEAEAEIERLRKRDADWRFSYGDTGRALDRAEEAEAEAERLRAALMADADQERAQDRGPTIEEQYAAAVDALLRCRGDRTELENTLTQARILGGQYLARSESMREHLDLVTTALHEAEDTIARVEEVRAWLLDPTQMVVEGPLIGRIAVESKLGKALRGPAPTEDGEIND